MKPGTRITVLLAEDHMVVREGLRTLLESEADIEVLGEAATGRQAVAMARDLRPNVVIMDIAMPRMNGMDATRRICEMAPDSKVLILSAHSDDAYVERAIDQGASGYLVKHTSADFLCKAIREIQQGGTFFSPTIGKRLSTRHPNVLDRKGRLKEGEAGLSLREIEVLQLIAEGLANKQIAAELDISVKTVEKHRGHLMQKLDIHDTAGLTRHAIAAGIVECDVQLPLE
jgi:DNA-binding NarL/FixJ family response regulator